MEITLSRRARQIAYNKEHGIVPRSVRRGAQASLHADAGAGAAGADRAAEGADDVAAVIAELEEEMQEAASRLEFEKAALIRDQVDALRSGSYKKLARPAGGRPRPTRAGSARRG
jgi:excinuclease ABC subunit B